MYTIIYIFKGVIPKNEFDNVYLYQPSMLPKGCVHITLESAWKIAKHLSIDYADACIGFNFRGGRAVPNIDGIVIKAEDERRFLESYQVSIIQQGREEIQNFKLKALTLWKKVIKASRLYSQFRKKDKESKDVDQGTSNTVGYSLLSLTGQKKNMEEDADSYSLNFENI